MSRLMSRPWKAAAIAVGVALLTGACGGEEPKMERPVDPRLAYAGDAKASDAPTGSDLMVIRLKNVKWDLVAPHFKKFLAQKHATPKDAFRPNTIDFVPRPVIPKRTQSVDASAVLPVEQEEPKSPLEQYALDDYKLLLIMSGTAVPKAVVIDPKGSAYVIQRDTRIGKDGGIVESITQYMVVVKEPNEEDPVKLAIKPPYLDMISESGLDVTGFITDDEYAVPPTMDVPVAPLPDER